MGRFKSLLTAIVALTALMWSADLFAQTKAVRLTRYQGDVLEGISVSSGFKVELSQGAVTSAVVEVNEELEKYLIFENKNGIVTVGLDGNAQNVFRRLRQRTTPHLVARIVVSDIKSISASSGSVVSVGTPVDEADFRLIVSSAAKVKMQSVKANTVKVNLASAASAEIEAVDAAQTEAIVSSSGKLRIGGVDTERIKINTASGSSVGIENMNVVNASMVASSASRITVSSGTADECDLNGASGSGINCESFKTDRAKVVLSSGSSGSLSVKDTLDISVSSAASLTYYGMPAVIGNRVSSGGRVVQRSAK